MILVSTIRFSGMPDLVVLSEITLDFFFLCTVGEIQNSRLLPKVK